MTRVDFTIHVFMKNVIRLLATIYSAAALIFVYRTPLQTTDVPFFIALHLALIISLSTFWLSLRRGSLLMLIAALLVVITGYYLLFNMDIRGMDFAYGLLCGPLSCAAPYVVISLVLWMVATLEHQDVTPGSHD